jgi:hypothetical protein
MNYKRDPVELRDPSSAKWPDDYELWVAPGEYTDSGKDEFGWTGIGVASKTLFETKEAALDDCIKHAKSISK